MTSQTPQLAHRVDQVNQHLGFDPIPRAGILSPVDALLVVPTGYIDATVTHNTILSAVGALANAQSVVFAEFKVLAIKGFNAKKEPVRVPFTRNTARIDILCVDKSNLEFTISTFSIWPWKEVEINNDLLVTMTSAQKFGNRYYVEAVPAEGRMLDVLGHVAPHYAGIPGAVKADRVTNAVDASVAIAMEERTMWAKARDHILAESHCAEEDLLAVSNTQAKSLITILRAMHRPQTIEEGMLARKASIQIAAAAVRARSQHFFAARPTNPECVIEGARLAAAKIVSDLSSTIKLTANQLQCINEICTMFESNTPSATMLNGDVGTGKTLTFLVPAIAAFIRKKNVAIMAPTGLLADQLALEMVNRFPSIPVARIDAGGKFPGDRAILIGTPGLTTVCMKAGWTPDVLIIDEQHKQATKFREALVGPKTHVIEASATPIPRSMAIALYSGMRQLILSESPVLKNIVTTAVYGTEGRAQMSREVSRLMNEGRKVAFIYAAVMPPKKQAKDGTGDDSVDVEMTDKERDELARIEQSTVLAAYERLNLRYPGKVARLYGKMSDEDQRREIDAMRNGDKSILVASTVVEVGVDIPSLDGMIVSNADRFGLSQLHQMRGRLARKGGTGHFMMFIEKPIEDVEAHTKERMSIMENTQDGFRLAEEDLAQRGFGDTLGQQQSGRAYTIFRGINLRPRDFLALSLPSSKTGNESISMSALPEVNDFPDEDEETPLEGQGALF